MGCSQSKIENEEAVLRCKERKQFMKEAVTTRNYFAAAHSAYTVSLKDTGAALSDYGQGEILIDHGTPSLSLPSSSQPPRDPLPPPPPLPNFGQIPLQRAATMPEFSIPKPDLKPTDTIEEEEDDDDQSSDLSHHRRSKSRIEEEPPPPSPPPSLPSRVSPQSSPPRRAPPNNPTPPPPEPKESAWEYFFQVPDMPMPSLTEVDETQPQSSKDYEDGGGNDYHNRHQRSKTVGDDGSDFGKSNNSTSTRGSISSSSKVENQIPEKVIEPTVVKPVEVVKQNVQSNSATVKGKRSGKGMSNVSLLKILVDLDDHFLRAYQSSFEVSRMLEANRLHYHSNFADNRGHIDHSKRVMRAITWNRSFRGLQNADDGNDEIETYDTLASVLDKLLAWEKKLYDEVKVGEVMKYEYQKKVASLNKQKSHGTSFETLEKTKAAVSHLHTRYIVDMQSLDSTVSEISNLRDDQLYPKLVSLIDGMARMWEAMTMHHKAQLKIVEDLKSLDVTQGPSETSDEHHSRTVQLWNIVEHWNSQFRKLTTHKKEFIKALNSWLKLNLIPIESSLKEKVSSPPRVHRPPVQSLLLAWQEYLENLPDELARGAISTFAHIIKNIMLHQEDEVKMKMKCEGTRKDLSRKLRDLEDLYNKHKDIGISEDANQKNPIVDKQIIVESLKKRLEEEVEAHQKQCRQVRDKSMVSLKIHLPELFQVMSNFASSSSIMYKKLQSIAHSQKNPAKGST